MPRDLVPTGRRRVLAAVAVAALCTLCLSLAQAHGTALADEAGVPITIRQETLDGSPVLDADGSELTVEVPASEYQTWTSETDVARGVVTSEAPAGLTFDASRMNVDATKTSYDQLLIEGQGGMTTLGGRDDVTGQFFRFMRWSGTALQWRRGNTSLTDVTAGPVTVHATYRTPTQPPAVTVRHLAADGTSVADDAAVTPTLGAGVSLADQAVTDSTGHTFDHAEAEGHEAVAVRYRWVVSGDTGQWGWQWEAPDGTWSAPVLGACTVTLDYADVAHHDVTLHHMARALDGTLSEVATTTVDANAGTPVALADHAQAPDGMSYSVARVGSATGEAATSVTPTEGSDGTWSGCEAWLVYDQASLPVTVRYVTDDGQAVASERVLGTLTRQTRNVSGTAGNGFTMSHPSTNAPDVAGVRYEGVHAGSVDGASVTAAWWRWSADAGWQFSPSGTGGPWSAGAPDTLYVIYRPRTMTLSFAGTDGSRLADDEMADEPLGQTLTRVFADEAGRFDGRAYVGATLADGTAADGLSFGVDGGSEVTLALVPAEGPSWTALDDGHGSVDGTSVTVSTDGGTPTSVTDGTTTWSLAQAPDGTWRSDTSSPAPGGRVWTVASEGGRLLVHAATWQASDQEAATLSYATDDDGQLAIADHVMASGRLDATASGDLARELAAATSVSWSWTRTRGGETSAVTRSGTSGQWNVAYRASDRSWLAPAADGGARAEDGTETSYAVTLALTMADGTTRTVTSAPYAVPWYGHLVDGSFEVPRNAGASFQWERAAYVAGGGAWRTTGSSGKIEYVDTEYPGYADSYSFGDAHVPGVAYTAGTADTGVQFAELNADTAGALYQDVMVVPGQPMSYWLAHRARGNDPARAEYDTMYLVILPTSEATDDGRDVLATQTQITDFIRSKIGSAYTTAKATSEEATKLYDADGVQIWRVSSDDQDWHRLSVTDGYVPTTSLVRFAFVAGPTSTGNDTIGNFLDDVGFGQEPLPVHDGTHALTVAKRIEGLTADQVSRLPLELTLHATPTDGHANDGDAALDGTTLSFSAAVGDDGALSVTPVATRGGTALGVADGFSGTATTDASGAVTIRWSFADQPLADGDSWDYSITEDGQSVSGMGCDTTVSGPATVMDSVTGHIAVENDYRPSDVPDKGHLTVTKRLDGIASWPAGETSDLAITVTRRSDGAQRVLSCDPDDQPDDVTFSESADHLTYSWSIDGWGAGDYDVSETGQNTSGYRWEGLSVNGQTVPGTSGTATVSGGVTEGSALGDVQAPDGTAHDLAEANLVVGRYATSSGQVRWMAWTPMEASASERAGITSLVASSGVAGGHAVTEGDVDFFHGTDLGTLSAEGARATISDGSLTLASTDAATWQAWSCGTWEASASADVELVNSYAGSSPVPVTGGTGTGAGVAAGLALVALAWARSTSRVRHRGSGEGTGPDAGGSGSSAS